MDGTARQAEVQRDEQNPYQGAEDPQAYTETALPSKPAVRPLATGAFFIHPADF